MKPETLALIVSIIGSIAALIVQIRAMIKDCKQAATEVIALLNEKGVSVILEPSKNEPVLKEITERQIQTCARIHATLKAPGGTP